MLTEKDMEDAIAKDPERYFGETGLKLVSRQHHIGSYVFDLLFEDRHGGRLIVELQRGTLDRVHTYKILDYYHEYKSNHPREFVDLMVVANQIPIERKQRLTDSGIAFREIPMSEFPGPVVPEICPTPKDERGTHDAPRPPHFSPLSKENRVSSNNYPEFWRGLLDEAKKRTDLFCEVQPSQKQLEKPYLGRHVKGLSRVSLVFVTSKTKNEAWVELCIERNAEESNDIMQGIQKHRADMEREFGEEIEWDPPKPGRNRGKIMSKKPRILFEMNQSEQWGEVQSALVDRMLRFVAVLRGRGPLPVNL